MATQERAICTSEDRWFKKALSPRCRLSGQAPDAISHIISGCTKLASTEIEHGRTKLNVLQELWIANRGRKKKQKNQQQPENKNVKIIFKRLELENKKRDRKRYRKCDETIKWRKNDKKKKKKKSLSFLLLKGDCSKKDARKGLVRAGAEENPVSEKRKVPATRASLDPH